MKCLAKCYAWIGELVYCDVNGVITLFMFGSTEYTDTLFKSQNFSLPKPETPPEMIGLKNLRQKLTCTIHFK